MSGSDHPRTARAAHRRRSARLALVATVAASLVFSGAGVAAASNDEPQPAHLLESEPPAQDQSQGHDASDADPAPDEVDTPSEDLTPPDTVSEAETESTADTESQAGHSLEGVDEPGSQRSLPVDSDPGFTPFANPEVPARAVEIIIDRVDAGGTLPENWYGKRLGWAWVTPSSWSAGEEYTVTTVYDPAFSVCGGGDHGGRSAQIYPAGTGGGPGPISFSPAGGTPPFTDPYYPNFSVSWGMHWSVPRNISTPNVTEGFTSGQVFTATFVAQRAHWETNAPRVKFSAVAANPTTGCDMGKHGPRVYNESKSVLVGGAPAEFPPIADFEPSADSEDPHIIRFENGSRDPRVPPRPLRFEWSFGDGSPVSTDENPSHRYDQPGRYTVTLTVTNDSGRSTTATREVTVLGGLIVNSTGDAAAEDPEQGCDTGDPVGPDEVPECTLRAAIEAANAAGSGEITFAIEDAPVIMLGSGLPRVEAPVTIDGTTQTGGWVEVIGGGLAGLRLAGPGSEVTGLALHGAEYGIGVGKGEHRLSGVRLGLDRSGAPTGDTGVGLGVEGGSASLDASEVAAEVGVSASGPVEITGSRIGVDGTGVAIPDVDAGVLIAGPESAVTGNTIHGETVGVLLYGAAASDAEVRENVIGVEGSGIGVSVQGAPGASITGNTIVADGHAGVLVSGSNQTTEVGDELELNSPLDEPAAGAVTGGDTLVDGNTISGDTLRAGVWAWAGADRVTVAETVITGTQYGVILDGGTGHTVRGSTIGSPESPAGLGIDAEDVSALRIGDTTGGGNTIVADGDAGLRLGLSGTSNQVSGNTITAVETVALTATGSGALTVTGNVVDAQAGFTIDDDFASLTVIGNTLTADSPESAQLSGILAAAGSSEFRGNEVTGFGTGIAVEAPEAAVAENVVLDAAIGGIVVAGDGSEVTDNRVANAGDGIVVAGQSVTVTDNRVGLEATGDTVVGNSGTGVLVRQGSAEVRGNAIAGSGGHGIDVASDATATLAANRIWLSDGQPINTATGPDAPTLRAAIAVYGQPNATRTTLLIEDIPEGAGGRIEVFADDSCTAPGGEAKHVLSATRTIEAGQTTRIVHLATGHDHLTVTYTDPAGNTSALSDCATRTDYADADNDGSVDPLDALLGWEADPTSGLLATPNEELLLVRAAPEFDSGGELGAIGGGVLRQLRIGEQPAGLPAGASMPYGAVFFEVHGIEPGGRAVVVLASLNEDVLQGTGYWKFGPATPGAAPSWYDFVFDQASFTGARMTTTDFGDALRNTYTLILADGGRGDADSVANGIVVDPGGPVIFAGGAGPKPGPAENGSLPDTGSDSSGLQLGLSLALILATLGAVLLVLRDRRGKQARVRH